MLAGLKQSQNVLSRVELAFDEPSDDGLSKLISSFLAGFDDVANNPDDMAARAQLVEQGKTPDAVKLLEKVIKDAPKDSDWTKAAQERLGKIDRK